MSNFNGPTANLRCTAHTPPLSVVTRALFTTIFFFFIMRYPIYRVSLVRAHVFIGLLFLRPSITAFGVQKSRGFPQLIKPEIETRQTTARNGFDFLFIIYTHNVLKSSNYYPLLLFEKPFNDTSLSLMPKIDSKYLRKTPNFT